ncbi:hypothetical protein RDI58_010687 [Solanum bulbocastanum]|uniref:DUF4283 domain-containing protein n=1 Tax=Solanum bulbocastanum TaxID=147425 RepID=A0AAN8YH02_SOLBU
MGNSLDYAPPTTRDGKLAVKLTKEDIRESDEHWATSLIRYVLGDTPFEKSMDNYVTTVWNFVHKPQILYHSDGYYVFRFASVADREEVMQADQYTYHNKPFMLRNLEASYLTQNV